MEREQALEFCRKPSMTRTGICLVFLLVLIGCSPPTPEEVVGHYSRTIAGVTDSIALAQDGTFRQDIRCTNGNWSTNGEWEITGRNIRLSRCYQSFDIEKQVVIVPPKLVYSSPFTLEDGKLVRSVLQPPWTNALVVK